ncbi:MAG: hypothetical protein WBG67_06870, partial [Thermoanaerobaculia bacterium]
MKPTNPDEVLDLLYGYNTSAALGAAMELGLFWLLEERPLDLRGVASGLGIPLARCSYWLELLSEAGLIEQGPRGYEPSAIARTSILDVHDQNCWGLLAEEVRERARVLGDLP